MFCIYQINATATTDVHPVIVENSDICPPGGISLSSQAEVDAFVASYPNCTVISGSLSIGIFSGSTDITDISGLANLQTITGYLYIRNNPLLPSLSGLDNVTSIGGYLLISNCDVLLNLNNLNNLLSIGDYLIISFNPALTSISGLINITSIPGFVSIGTNVNLTSLNGLDNVTSIGGLLKISLNFDLTSLAALSNITSVSGDIIITYNFDLTSLSGLENVSSATITGLTIQNNFNLSTCEIYSLCEYLDNGGSATISSNAAGCNTLAEVNANCQSVLPVELIQFEGAFNDNAVQLIWATASERNNEGFQIEHTIGENQWAEIGFVKGVGTSSETNKYEYRHRHAKPGHHYYRLKQIDYNGMFEYSDVVHIFIEKENEIKIYPNPTNGKIEITGLEMSGTELSIIDNTGTLVSHQILSQQYLDISYLPSGLYFLLITNGTQTFEVKMIKK